MTGPTPDGVSGETAVAHILNTYPSLTPEEALAFLYICAEDGLSLKALSKRLGEGQSTAARFVTALEQTEANGTGLVVLSESQEGSLRRTVRLSEAGCILQAELTKVMWDRT